LATLIKQANLTRCLHVSHSGLHERIEGREINTSSRISPAGNGEGGLRPFGEESTANEGLPVGRTLKAPALACSGHKWGESGWNWITYDVSADVFSLGV
jgi:hypothetical protein